jgi:hypothetical protein
LDFPFRAALPHHNDLAVDCEQKPNALYPSALDADGQFRWRFQAACNHIKQAYLSHPEAGGEPAWP